jgi:hypothetical protein
VGSGGHAVKKMNTEEKLILSIDHVSHKT